MTTDKKKKRTLADFGLPDSLYPSEDNLKHFVGPESPIASALHDLVKELPQETKAFLDSNLPEINNHFGTEAKSIQPLVSAWQSLCAMVNPDPDLKLAAMVKASSDFDACWGRETESSSKTGLFSGRLKTLASDDTVLNEFLKTQEGTVGTWVTLFEYLKLVLSKKAASSPTIGQTSNGARQEIGKVTVDSSESKFRIRSLTVPVALVQVSQGNVKNATIAHFQVDQCNFGIGHFFPHANAVGLAVIDWNTQTGWLNSFGHNALKAALNCEPVNQGLPQLVRSDKSYFWRLNAFPFHEDQRKSWDNLSYSKFQERSCEATVVCALWALTGIGPISEDGQLNWTKNEAVQLDPKTVITAAIDENELHLGPMAKLTPVTGVMQKIKAAARAGIDNVIVATGQLTGELKEQIESWDSSWIEDCLLYTSPSPRD